MRKFPPVSPWSPFGPLHNPLMTKVGLKPGWSPIGREPSTSRPFRLRLTFPSLPAYCITLWHNIGAYGAVWTNVVPFHSDAARKKEIAYRSGIYVLVCFGGVSLRSSSRCGHHGEAAMCQKRSLCSRWSVKGKIVPLPGEGGSSSRICVRLWMSCRIFKGHIFYFWTALAYCIHDGQGRDFFYMLTPSQLIGYARKVMKVKRQTPILLLHLKPLKGHSRIGCLQAMAVAEKKCLLRHSLVFFDSRNLFVHWT